MKRIIYIHHCEIKGGSSISLANIISGLNNKFEIAIYTPSGSVLEVFEPLNVEIRRIPLFTYFAITNGVRHAILKRLYGFRYSLNLFKIANRIKNDRADIIHFNEIGMVLLLFLLRKHRAKKIIHVRAVANKKFKLLNSFVSYLVNNYTDLAIFIDCSVQNSYPKIKKYEVIYNSFSKMKPFEMGLIKNKKSFDILFLGLLNESNGIFDLIKAAEILKDDSSIKFHIAGGFSRKSSMYNNIFMKFLEISNILPDIEKRVKTRFEPLSNLKYYGFVSDIEKLFAKIDIVVFPSFYNGTGRSVFELGANGIPSLVCLEDQIEDIVQNGVNGVIIEPGNPNLLAETLLNLSINPEKVKDMGLKAKDKFRIQHNIASSQELIISAYGDLMKTEK